MFKVNEKFIKGSHGKDRWRNVYLAECDIHYSRIIASWIKAGGNLKTRKDEMLFTEWLRNIASFTDDQIDDILLLATNGKLEWQENARVFLKKSV